MSCSELQRVAVSCSVLQCVVICVIERCHVQCVCVCVLCVRARVFVSVRVRVFVAMCARVCM